MILVSLESEINCRLVLYLEVWEPSLQLIRITVKEFILNQVNKEMNMTLDSVIAHLIDF